MTYYTYSAVMAWPLAKDFSIESFRAAATEYSSAIRQILIQKPATHSDEAVLRLFAYVNIQVSRAAQWIGGDVDLLAYVLRNLVEAHFWSRLMAQGECEAETFLAEEQIDLAELNERILKAMPEIGLKGRKSGGKRIRVERWNDTEEMIYKMCSKYIHPTSFLLARLDGLSKDETARQALAKMIMLLAWQTLEASGVAKFSPSQAHGEQP